MSLGFLKSFEKQIKDIEGVGDSSLPPRYWYSSGNYVLNYIVSGSCYKAIPQGRITALVGSSGTGKSFLLGNFLRAAQKDGAFIFLIDSENAFDDVFATNLGIDIENNYLYRSAITIANVTKLVSSFCKAYREAQGEGDLALAPKIVIAIDSLDMLSTDTELEHWQKGDNSSDQGLRAKQQKLMLRQFVQAIKDLNISIIVTGQVYSAKQEQILKGEGVWVVNEAIRFALSQIIMLKKLRLRDKEKNVIGFRMTAEGFKTRFTKPFQSVEIDVPYDTGMDPLSGLKEVLLVTGIIVQEGSSYVDVSTGDKFMWKNAEPFIESLVMQLELQSNKFLNADVSDEDIEPIIETTTSTKAKRKENATK